MLHVDFYILFFLLDICFNMKPSIIIINRHRLTLHEGQWHKFVSVNQLAIHLTVHMKRRICNS